MTFRFLTDCVHSREKWIVDMTDQAREITWKTFRKNVPVEEVRRIFPTYSYNGETYNPETGDLTIGFHIKDDYGVGFYKSVYRGQLCYYLDHSRIEYIFVEADDL